MKYFLNDILMNYASKVVLVPPQRAFPGHQIGMPIGLVPHSCAISVCTAIHRQLRVTKFESTPEAYLADKVISVLDSNNCPEAMPQSIFECFNPKHFKII